MTRDLADTVPPEVLEAFGFAGASVEQIATGLFNAHWLAADGERLAVFRRYNPARTAAAAAWEQALVEHAASKGWPVAAPLAAATGATLLDVDGKLWAAMPYLEGKPAPEDRPARYHIIGRLLGRLHHDLASFEVAGQRPDFGKTWELDAWVAAANAGSFNDILAAFTREYPDLGALVRRQRYRNLRELSRLHYPDLADMPVHGDFQRNNLLWADGQLTGVLDFDLSRRDAQVCDLATLLMPGMPLDLKLASSLLEGYQEVRPLSGAEWELLVPLARASLLNWVSHLLLGWRLRGGETGGIARTMTVRFPALEVAEPAFVQLRNGLRV